jgi:hypothetical protein
MSGAPDIEIAFSPILEPTLSVLEYPFSFITNGDYKVTNFCRGVPGDEPCDPGNFPNNIAEFYWIHEGAHDEEPWTCLCRLDSGLYVFYLAHCDYTGFDCQGEMVMFVARAKELLFYQGLTSAQRRWCLAVKRSKLDLNKMDEINRNESDGYSAYSRPRYRHGGMLYIKQLLLSPPLDGGRRTPQ